MMNLAIVGCGFVADYYVKTLALHPELKLLGAMDRLPERAQRFSDFHGVPIYNSLAELLADSRVELVLNLTNPGSHYEVSKACLEVGKHVYSEKPISTDIDQAKELVALAKDKGLLIASAPCNVLSETAQTVWQALREKAIGAAYLVYAEMDDGMVHQMAYDQWLSESGVPWPYKDEFEVGCTLEHAGYYVTWLVAFFGPAVSLTAFSDCLIPDKQTALPLEKTAPDFSVACIKFASGMVARLTCGIVAPHDHKLTIVGEKGLLYTEDCWYYGSPVYIKKRMRIRRKTFISPLRQKYPFIRKPGGKIGYKGSQQMDFCRGVADLAQAIKSGGTPKLTADYCLHVNEIVLAIQNAWQTGAAYQLTTTCEPFEPGF